MPPLEVKSFWYSISRIAVSFLFMGLFFMICIYNLQHHTAVNEYLQSSNFIKKEMSQSWQ
jgi:hypothetical protein